MSTERGKADFTIGDTFFANISETPEKKVKKGLALRNIGKNIYILNCKLSAASISVAPVLVTDLFMYSGTWI